MNAVVALSPAWFGPLILGLTLITGACSPRNASTDARQPDTAERAADQPGGMHSSSQWPAYNGGFNATRFSPVTTINTGNVASLTEVARFRLPETMAFQSGPVLIDGTMYVTTSTNTYAIDARTAEQRWSHHFEPKSMGLGPGAWRRLCRRQAVPRHAGRPSYRFGCNDRQADLGCCRR